MNKHLCRGKRLDNGDWVTGFYINMRHNDQRTHIHHFIIPLDSDMSYGALLENVLVEVDPATVGRCTGVVAAKSYRGDTEADRLIWEGDIATYKRSSAYTAHNAVICWSKTDAGFEIKYEHGVDYLQGGDDIEIISTIHNEGSAE